MRKDEISNYEYFEALIETVWQIPAFITLLGVFITYKLFVWAESINQNIAVGKNVWQIFQNIPWIFYILPCFVGFLTISLFIMTTNTVIRNWKAKAK